MIKFIIYNFSLFKLFYKLISYLYISFNYIIKFIVLQRKIWDNRVYL